MNYITFIWLAGFFLLGIYVFINWKDIYNKFKPEKFYRIYFYGEDGYLSSWLYFKKSITDKNIKIGPDVYLLNKNYFISGRNKSYLFIEGNLEAVNLLEYKVKEAVNPSVLNKFLETNIANLFIDKMDLSEFIKKYGVIILIVGGILLFILMFGKGG